MVGVEGRPGGRQVWAHPHGPGGSGTHRSEKVPTEQGRGIPVPTGQKWPGGQGPPAMAWMHLSRWVTSAPAQSQKWVRSQSSRSPAQSQSLSNPHLAHPLKRTFPEIKQQRLKDGVTSPSIAQAAQVQGSAQSWLPAGTVGGVPGVGLGS